MQRRCRGGVTQFSPAKRGPVPWPGLVSQRAGNSAVTGLIQQRRPLRTAGLARRRGFFLSSSLGLCIQGLAMGIAVLAPSLHCQCRLDRYPGFTPPTFF
jgi:hypothetical protein